MEDSSKIEIYFNGGDIAPENVRSTDVGELLVNFEATISGIIQEGRSVLKKDALILTIEGIEKGSLRFLYNTPVSTFVVPALITVATAINTNDYSSIPKKSLESLKGLTNFTRKYNCSGRFIKDGQSIAVFDGTTRIGEDLNKISGKTTVFAEVLRAGGDTPRVLLNIRDGKHLSVEVGRDLAIELGKALYKFIAIDGVATWDTETYDVLSLKVDSFKIIEGHSNSETFSQLAEYYSKHTDLGDLELF